MTGSLQSRSDRNPWKRGQLLARDTYEQISCYDVVVVVVVVDYNLP